MIKLTITNPCLECEMLSHMEIVEGAYVDTFGGRKVIEPPKAVCQYEKICKFLEQENS